MDVKLLSVQIVTYNTCDLTKKAIEAVHNATIGLPSEIIVVDNASSDDTVQVIQSDFPDCFVIRNVENLYFSRGQNQASKVATGKYLLVLNSDVIVNPEILKAMIDYLETNESVGCVAPALVDVNGIPQQVAWERRSALEILLTRNPLMYLTKSLSLRRQVVHDHNPISVEVVSGACMMVRQKLFLSLGGFDETMLMYASDDDLCCRIWEMGYAVHFLPGIRAVHHASYSTRSSSWKKMNIIRAKDIIAYFKKRHNAASAFIVGVALYSEHFLGIIWKRLRNRLN
jgi:GT2 family glycosyltransferase